MNTPATQARENEVTILARLFDDERAADAPQTSPARSSMWNSASGGRPDARPGRPANQADALITGREGRDLRLRQGRHALGIFKSKARRTLKIKPTKRTLSLSGR